MLPLRRVISLVALAAAPPLAGCRGDFLWNDFDTGTYDLRAVNGRLVPSTVQASVAGPYGYRLDVYAGSVTLRRDGTFSLYLAERVEDRFGVSDQTRAFTGTYWREGRELELSFYDPLARAWAYAGGTWRDGRVEFNLPGPGYGVWYLARFER